MENLTKLCENLNNTVQAKWEIITPDVAAEMLQHRNQHNRNLKKRTVDSYSRDMSNGRWKQTGEPIIIDSTGMVANGHHRLSAVLKSGSSIISLVVRGVSPESIEDMDQHAKRTISDIFTMNKIENATNLSSIVKTVLEYESTNYIGVGRSGASSGYVPSVSEINSEFEANMEDYQWAGKLSRKVNDTNKLINPRVIGSMAYILLTKKHHPKETIEDFFYQFADQRDFCSGVIRQLRQKLTQDKQSGSAAKMSSQAKRYYLFKTWNLFVKGEVKLLQGFSKTAKIELI